MFNTVKYQEYHNVLANSDFHPDEINDLLKFLLHAGYFGNHSDYNSLGPLSIGECQTVTINWYFTESGGRVS